EKLVALVIEGYDGSLKAEHGTGVNMAPFVELEWGRTATEMMWRIKGLADPDGVLGPGVVLNRDPGCHLEGLKTTPPIEEVATTCVECGFCEPVCPSRDLTTTPRQRIVLRRELQRAKAAGDAALVAEIEDDYGYAGIDTCAVDGMCQTACPVLINTGDLVKRLRQERAGNGAGWTAAARHWAGATRAASMALDVAAALPSPLVAGVTALGRKLIDPEVLPAWSPE